jgi:hypothetical protein
LEWLIDFLYRYVVPRKIWQHCFPSRPTEKNKVNFRRIQSKIEKHIFSASPVCEILRALVANGLTLVLDYQGCQIFLGTKYQNE